jgi:DNA-directed RNA polymerase subunit beta'
MKSKDPILELEKSLLKLENLHASFDYLRVTIASPKRIKSWGERRLPNGQIIGEVLRPETMNFRSHQPELDGLFCEKIFGPVRNWECRCGKFKGFLLETVCDECYVELIEARVRRYRMGYIELTCPVTHLWYLKGIPNYLCILLRCFDEELTVSDLEQIVYFKEGERAIPYTNPLFRFLFPERRKQSNELRSFFLTEIKKKEPNSKRKPGSPIFVKVRKFKKRIGAEILKAALESINIKEEIRQSRSFLFQTSLRNINSFSLPEKGVIRRIRILESFLATEIKPEWIILTLLPVLPPNLRPLLELENGRLVAADANEIYRLVITRNLRLFDFLYNFLAPDIITVHGRKLLQEAVDSLIDNARLPKEKIFSLNNKPLKSLTEILEGKPGRFRQSLLGKRVDYSGRSVIVVGPNLRLNQCGLPYDMAIELFQPFLINELLKTKIKPPSHNTKLANVIIKKNKPFLWTLLGKLTRKYCILLNRAPTLHRFGIQAFDPVLILGQAIQLHPLVCTGFNADFDGDQMAVHLPLYESSQLEARTLMRPSYNVISPSNAEVILKPTQDMVIGCYYLTLMMKKYSSGIQKCFSNEKDALFAFYQKKVEIHTSILIRYSFLNFQMKIEEDSLIFLTSDSFLTTKKEIHILKIFQTFSTETQKYFLVTNLGIFLLREDSEKKLYVTDLFLETTPGRIIFSSNVKISIEKTIEKIL